MGLSVSLSSVVDPRGPESVRFARLPAHPGWTGRTKANDELPSPSATSGMSKSSMGKVGKAEEVHLELVARVIEPDVLDRLE